MHSLKILSSGGWHHGFTHSFSFSLIVGFVVAVSIGKLSVKSVVTFALAVASHPLLDLLFTESRGVSLFWPITDKRFKLMIPTPIDYGWQLHPVSEMLIDLLKICLLELVLFGPLFLMALRIKQIVAKKSER